MLSNSSHDRKEPRHLDQYLQNDIYLDSVVPGIFLEPKKFLMCSKICMSASWFAITCFAACGDSVS